MNVYRLYRVTHFKCDYIKVYIIVVLLWNDKRGATIIIGTFQTIVCVIKYYYKIHTTNYM